jgi:hypothetical protein
MIDKWYTHSAQRVHRHKKVSTGPSQSRLLLPALAHLSAVRDRERKRQLDSSMWLSKARDGLALALLAIEYDCYVHFCDSKIL